MRKIFIALFLLVGIASQAQVLPVIKGGTGATTTAKALKNLFPDTTGHAGDLLGVTKGGGFSWQTVSGGGGSGTQICEIPSGAENDTNTVFTISHTPVSDTTTDFEVYRNGLHLNPFTHDGWGAPDYTISGTTLTFTVPPSAMDIILTRYRY